MKQPIYLKRIGDEEKSMKVGWEGDVSHNCRKAETYRQKSEKVRKLTSSGKKRGEAKRKKILFLMTGPLSP